jgi:hypothetical protein
MLDFQYFSTLDAHRTENLLSLHRCRDDIQQFFVIIISNGHYVLPNKAHSVSVLHMWLF